MNNIKIVNINGNKDLITQGILFDDEHTCYHDYVDFNDIIIGFMLVADNYGIFYNDEFIVLIIILQHYYKINVAALKSISTFTKQGKKFWAFTTLAVQSLSPPKDSHL